jgi:broad specificity phosphatase PhoE
VEFWLVRHAEPQWGRDGLILADPPLSARGVAEADRLADRMTRAELDTIYSSPLLRARQTAERIAGRTGHRVEVVEWLEEVRTPSWAGKTTKYIRELISQTRELPPDDHWARFPDSETLRDFSARVLTGLEDALAERGIRRRPGDVPVWDGTASGESILLVGHQGSLGVALSHFLGAPPCPWEWDRFAIAHASVSHAKVMPLGGAQIFSLDMFNSVGHLLDPAPAHTT